MGLVRPNFLFVAAVLLIPAAGIHAEPNDSSAASQTPSAEEIHGLIVELDAASYESRRSAMQQLIQIGRGVPSTLAPAISQGERELVTRGVHILEVLATNDEPQLRDEARDALIGVVEQSESPTARAQAVASLDKVDRVLQARALAVLEGFGAEVRFRGFRTSRALQANVFSSSENSIVFGDAWRGDGKALEQLRFVTYLENLEFSGDAVDLDCLRHATLLPYLASITLSKVSLRDDQLVPLAEMRRLRQLRVLYAPLTDSSIARLAELKQVHRIELRGTQISSAAADRLQADLASVTLLYHRGAFLGVGPGDQAPNQFGFVVGLVSRGSAAEKAGIQPGDIIMRIGDDATADFVELQTAMQKLTHGTPVDVVVRRAGQEKKLSLTLGEKPDDQDLFDPRQFNPVPFNPAPFNPAPFNPGINPGFNPVPRPAVPK